MATESWNIKVGPSENSSYYHSPTSFDLLGENEISQIFVSTGDQGIKSIRFHYKKNGKYVLSGQYGSNSIQNQFHTIELNHPAEYITGVKGYTETSSYIQMITFTTNIKEYGPFGITNPNLLKDFSNPKWFEFNLGKSNQFGGFHGSYNQEGLLSIGLYLFTKKLQPKIVPKTEA